MFEKFGEFNSAEELNRAALAQRNEGDEEALKLLAEENGIDIEDAEDFMDMCMDELATPLMAAMGKLKVETEDLAIKGVLLDWVQELQAECADSEQMAHAVRQKGKDLAGYIAKLADYGYEHRTTVDKKIVAKCGKLKGIVGNNEFAVGVPDKTARRRIMIEHYLGKKVEA